MGGRTDTNYYLIMNPASRGGKSSELFEQIHEEFQKYGLTYDHAVTTNLNEAETLSREACQNGYDVVVAVGGDGTINRVLNGFYLPGGSRTSTARLGVIYSGTSPDFCLSHSLPVRNVPRAVAALAALETKRIGIGRICFTGNGSPGSRFDSAQSGKPDDGSNISLSDEQNNQPNSSSNCIPAGNSSDKSYIRSSGKLNGRTGEDPDGNSGGLLRHFACCANIGIGPALAESANSGVRSRFGDKTGTFLALLRTLKSYRPVNLTVNGESFSGVYNLSIGKTQYVASGLKISHTLKPDDDRLYMLCIQNRILGHIIDLYQGNPMPLTYVTEAVVTGDAAVEFDGDPWGRLPVTITTAPPLEVIYERT